MNPPLEPELVLQGGAPIPRQLRDQIQTLIRQGVLNEQMPRDNRIDRPIMNQPRLENQQAVQQKFFVRDNVR